MGSHRPAIYHGGRKDRPRPRPEKQRARQLANTQLGRLQAHQREPCDRRGGQARMRMRTTIPLSQRIGALYYRALAIACLAYLEAMTPGCSIMIARTSRIGPDPDHVIVAPATRTDVERVLGRPIETERLADG